MTRKHNKRSMKGGMEATAMERPKPMKPANVGPETRTGGTGGGILTPEQIALWKSLKAIWARDTAAIEDKLAYSTIDIQRQLSEILYILIETRDFHTIKDSMSRVLGSMEKFREEHHVRERAHAVAQAKIAKSQLPANRALAAQGNVIVSGGTANDSVRRTQQLMNELVATSVPTHAVGGYEAAAIASADSFLVPGANITEDNIASLKPLIKTLLTIKSEASMAKAAELLTLIEAHQAQAQPQPRLFGGGGRTKKRTKRTKKRTKRTKKRRTKKRSKKRY